MRFALYHDRSREARHFGHVENIGLMEVGIARFWTSPRVPVVVGRVVGRGYKESDSSSNVKNHHSFEGAQLQTVLLVYPSLSVCIFIKPRWHSFPFASLARPSERLTPAV